MKNLDLSEKIKDLRKRRGLSQDELASTSGLSLRTVQRIESGETQPHGHTLKSLSTALNITSEELVVTAESTDKKYLVIIHLSALSFIVFPFLGILFPLTLWLLKKDKIQDVSKTGKSLLNFQITWCLVIFIAVFVKMFRLDILSIDENVEILPFILSAYTFNFLLVILNALRCLKSRKVFYQPAIPFFR